MKISIRENFSVYCTCFIARVKSLEDFSPSEEHHRIISRIAAVTFSHNNLSKCMHYHKKVRLSAIRGYESGSFNTFFIVI